MTGPPEPILAFRFQGPECRPLTEYTELQMSVMPLVGVATGVLTPLATCFWISTGAPLVITVWHVIREIRRAQSRRTGGWRLPHRRDMGDRRAAAGTDLDLGGPQPVFEVMYQDDSDLALLLLYEVTSRGRVLAPAAVKPLSFRVAAAADYCYGFGYPHLKGSPISVEGDRRVVDFERTLHVCAGRVVEPFPRGQDGHAMVSGPSLHCDAPLMHGMSGGPVLTDEAGVCGAWSTGLEPYDHADPWTSYVTLLHPMLEFEVNGLGRTVRELVLDGVVEIDGPVPPPPARRPATHTITFGQPSLPSPGRG